MAGIVFKKVWYLPAENKWEDKNLLAMRDTGTVELTGNSIVFRSKKGQINITGISSVTYGKQGRDFVNNWVKVEYMNGNIAYFADGSLLGWGGMFGGTMKLFKAIFPLVQNR